MVDLDIAAQHAAHAASQPLQGILILLLSAIGIASLFQRLQIGLILGYMVAGALIGPNGLGLVVELNQTRALAEFGVVFLLFAVGLELNIHRLFSLRRLVFGLGGTQVVVTSLVLGFLGWAVLGETPVAAGVIGAALALSSTAFVLPLLSERGELSRRYGRAVLATLLFQDLAVVPMLVILPLLQADPQALALALVLAVLKGVLAVAVIVGLGHLVLRRAYHMIVRVRKKELFTATTLAVVLGIGWATQMAGLSITLGAFLAGLILAESEFRHQIEVEIMPFRGMLLGLFFMTVGMGIDFTVAWAHASQVLALLVGLLSVKAGLIYLMARGGMGFPRCTSARIAVALSQGGEFAFILLSIAVQNHLIASDTVQILFVIVVLSMAVTPALFRLLWPLIDMWECRAAPVSHHNIADAGVLADHVIIAGGGRVGRVVARLMRESRVPYIILDMEPDSVSEARAAGEPAFFGDATRVEILELAGAGKAMALVATHHQTGAMVATLSELRAAFPMLPVFVRVRDPRQAVELEELGATAAVPDVLESSLQLGAAVLRDIGHPDDEINALVVRLRHVRRLVSPQPGKRPAGRGAAGRSTRMTARPREAPASAQASVSAQSPASAQASAQSSAPVPTATATPAATSAATSAPASTPAPAEKIIASAGSQDGRGAGGIKKTG